MTSRQRGPSHSNNRPPNGHGPTAWGRRGSADDWEPLYIDTSTAADRDFRGSRESLREGRHDVVDHTVPGQYTRRPRHESTASTQTRQPLTSFPEDARTRVNPSPNRMYKEDGRPRPEHLSTTQMQREKHYYGPGDYQPPQFPQNPYPGSRPVSAALEGQGSARGSRPGSRNQSPIPPYPSTPPPTHLRHDNGSSERIQSNVTRFPEPPRTPEHPYQLAPLRFSPPRIQDSLLAGTQFDNLSNVSGSKISPPAPLRPPPAPPSRHTANVALSPRSVESPRPTSMVESESIRNTPSKAGVDEEWTLENVIEFLRTNGFGEPWQQAFRDANICGDRFRACASYTEAKKLVNVPHDTGKTPFKLITLIRKVLNPDSDTPDSETSTPTPKPPEKDRPPGDRENQPVQSQTAPPSNQIVPSPESPSVPALPIPRQVPRHNSEQHATFGPPSGRHEPTAPLKLQTQPRARSPLESKRPLSPSMDPRQVRIPPQTTFLGQYNRHSKNMSNGSDLSDQASLRSATQPTRSSQDFQDIVSRLSKEGTIVPPRKIDKKKSTEQMSKGGIFSRFFQRDRQKEVQPDLVQFFLIAI